MSSINEPPLRALPVSGFFLGAVELPRALGFLVRHPRLWPEVALPVVVTGALIVVGVLGAATAVGFLLDPIVSRLSGVDPFLLWILLTGILAGIIALGLLLGLALALALLGPLLERLSLRVERLVIGESAGDGGPELDLRDAFSASFYFLIRAPAIFLLSLVPLVGPVLGVMWAGHSLAFQQTESALTRRGLSFAARRQWHRDNRAASMGFGLSGVLFMLIPVANLLLLPTVVVGATRLVLRLDPGRT